MTTCWGIMFKMIVTIYSYYKIEVVFGRKFQYKTQKDEVKY